MEIRKLILVLSLIITLITIGLSVANREKLLKNGETVLFELSPVDPRSIMQGDYMTLNYRIISGVNTDHIPSRGYMAFTTDSLNVARCIRFQKDKHPLFENEKIIRYFCHKWNISIGSESFFFQEGDEKLYSAARYGGIKVGKNGESILTGLFDENRKEIIKE